VQLGVGDLALLALLPAPVEGDAVTVARLDMPGAIKSLNVSNAAAVALYAPDATLESPLVNNPLGREEGVVSGREDLRRFFKIIRSSRAGQNSRSWRSRFAMKRVPQSYRKTISTPGMLRRDPC